jgi:hypothetical protein
MQSAKLIRDVKFKIKQMEKNLEHSKKMLVLHNKRKDTGEGMMYLKMTNLLNETINKQNHDLRTIKIQLTRYKSKIH